MTSSPSAAPAAAAAPVRSPYARLGRAILPMIAVFGVFGIITVFWGTPTEDLGAIVSGAFFVLMGLAVEWARRQVAAAGLPAGRASQGAAMGPALMLVIIGVFHFFLLNQMATSVLAGLGWIALGLIHLVFAVKGPRALVQHPLSQDWLLLGVVSLVTGAWLVFTHGLGTHGQLGIAGGGAIIITVFWAISAVSLIKGYGRYNEELPTTHE